MKNNFIALCFLFSLVFFSCKKDEKTIVPINYGYNYAGLTVGKYVIYDVDSIFYNVPFGIIKNFKFQLKEVVDSKYIDAQGKEAYKIIRYKKDTAVSPDWVHQVVWNATITNSNFQKVEDNVRFVKLIFPVKNGKKWNGNSMNTLSAWEYEYASTHQPERIGTTNLDSVTTVTQFDDGNEILIQRQFYQEKYATNIGLVYKKSVDITKKFDSISGTFQNSEGLDVTYTFNAVGLN
jgi:hypothetical protein